MLPENYLLIAERKWPKPELNMKIMPIIGQRPTKFLKCSTHLERKAVDCSQNKVSHKSPLALYFVLL